MPYSLNHRFCSPLLLTRWPFGHHSCSLDSVDGLAGDFNRHIQIFSSYINAIAKSGSVAHCKYIVDALVLRCIGNIIWFVRFELRRHWSHWPLIEKSLARFHWLPPIVPAVPYHVPDSMITWPWEWVCGMNGEKKALYFQALHISFVVVESLALTLSEAVENLWDLIYFLLW